MADLTQSFNDIVKAIPKVTDMPGESLQAKFIAFTIQFLTLLLAADPTDTFGYVGAFLNPANFEIYQAPLPTGTPAEVWSRLPEPLELNIPEGGNAAKLIYEHSLRITAFSRERDQLVAIQHYLHQALPPHIQDTFINEVSGRAHLGTTTKQWEDIVKSIGPITQSHLNLEHAKLIQPYRLGNSLQDFFHVHDSGHRFRTHVRFPYPELDKVNLAIAALSECGIFDRSIRSFYSTTPELSAQRYSSLKTLLLSEGDRDMATTKTMLHSVSATAATTSNLERENKQLKEQLRTLQRSTTAPSDKPYKQGTNHFCWTCGPQQSHPSHRCPNPASGHQNATRSDKKNSPHA